MQTRIRQLRKNHNLTLQQLADRIGTTPQTIQRLETENMTVSIQWLTKLAQAFNVFPADLVEGGPGRDIPLLGHVDRNGHLVPQPGRETIHFPTPMLDPVAVIMSATLGRYQRQATLIGERTKGRSSTNALGHDCLVGHPSGMIHLCRVITGKGNLFTLVPIRPGGEVYYDQPLEWTARIMIKIEYY
jgi:transcriptional regulator with XRE-family HTH domain